MSKKVTVQMLSKCQYRKTGPFLIFFLIFWKILDFCDLHGHMSPQYRNKSKSQLTSPTPAQLPAVALSTGHIV
jgi:hypothetical protein